MKFFIVDRQLNVTKGKDNKKAPAKPAGALFKRFEEAEGSV